jgi:hypothetical protein
MSKCKKDLSNKTYVLASHSLDDDLSVLVDEDVWSSGVSVDSSGGNLVKILGSFECFAQHVVNLYLFLIL